LELTIEETHEATAAACTPWIMAQLDAAVAKQGIRPLRLPSGAGHDAMAFSGFCPLGMLFQRCTGGISHNPAETVTLEDTEIATRVLLDFIENFEPGE
jgi:allantoate deiminase